MRIIAGRYKSRRLKAGPSKGTRPTGDKLRETLFNILGDRVLESVFLDAYAGVGAIGIEAISRGARTVYLVDRSASACRSIRANVESLDVGSEYRILKMEIADAFRAFLTDRVRFDLVFLDPPYAREDFYHRDLERLGSGALLNEGALVIAEHSKLFDLPNRIPGLVHVRTQRQGDSALTFYEMEGQ